MQSIPSPCPDFMFKEFGPQMVQCMPHVEHSYWVVRHAVPTPGARGPTSCRCGLAGIFLKFSTETHSVAFWVWLCSLASLGGDSSSAPWVTSSPPLIARHPWCILIAACLPSHLAMGTWLFSSFGLLEMMLQCLCASLGGDGFISLARYRPKDDGRTVWLDSCQPYLRLPHCPAEYLLQLTSPPPMDRVLLTCGIISFLLFSHAMLCTVGAAPFCNFTLPVYHHRMQAGLKLRTLPPQPPHCWYCWRAPPHPNQFLFTKDL